MGTISLRFQAHVPISPIEPNDFVTEFMGDILYTTDDKTRRIGAFDVTRVNIALGKDLDEAAWEIFDAHSARLADDFQIIFSHNTDDFKESIKQYFCTPDFDLLIIDSIILSPKFRGRGLGLMAARTIVDQLGWGCGLTVAMMTPVLPCDADEARVPRRWLPGVSDFCTQADAKGKIARHFEKMGFERIGQSELWGLSHGLRRPTARDLDKLRRRR